MTKWIKILSIQSFLDSHLQMMAVWFPLLVWGLIFSTSRFTTLCPVVGYLYVPPPTVLLTSSASVCITVASCMLRVWPVSMHPVGRMRYLILFNIVFRLICLTISDLDFFFLFSPPLPVVYPRSAESVLQGRRGHSSSCFPQDCGQHLLQCWHVP